MGPAPSTAKGTFASHPSSLLSVRGFAVAPAQLCRSLVIIAPFYILKQKPLTTRSVPSCLRGRVLIYSHSVIPYGQFAFYKSRLFLIFGEMVGCLGGILQQNNPLFPVSLISSWLVLVLSALLPHSLTQPCCSPNRLLSSFLPVALVAAGILICEVHIESYLVCWSSSFLASKGKSPFSISSLSSGCPVCVTATGLYLGLVLFLFFWYFSLLL